MSMYTSLFLKQKSGFKIELSFHMREISYTTLPIDKRSRIFLLFVIQVVRVWRFRCDKGIECKLCAEAEADDEAVEGGLAIIVANALSICHRTSNTK